MLQCKFVISV